MANEYAAKQPHPVLEHWNRPGWFILGTIGVTIPVSHDVVKDRSNIILNNYDHNCLGVHLIRELDVDLEFKLIQ